MFAAPVYLKIDESAARLWMMWCRKLRNSKEHTAVGNNACVRKWQWTRRILAR